MRKYEKLRNRIEAVAREHTERFDIFGDGRVFLTMTQVRELMAHLEGRSRGLPSQRYNPQ